MLNLVKYVVGTFGHCTQQIGVGVGDDGPSQFVALVSVQSLYTQNVSLHQVRHGANEETIRALGLFIPSASTHTEHRHPERWPYADACPRACSVSDRLKDSRTVPTWRL